MLPQNRLASIPVTAPLLPPDDQASSPVVDYERGGIALNDPSQGLLVQNWTCFIAPNGYDVTLQPEIGAAVVIFQQSAIDSLSFTFDQNMRPCVVYSSAETVYLRWYDSVPQAYVTTSFGTGIRDPRVCLDDKRLTQFALSSDIIFAYIKGSTLCYRQQRDRFAIERELQYGIAPNVRLTNVAMNKALRLQFDLV